MARNAGEVKDLLDTRVAEGGDAMANLATIGPILLQMLTGLRGVALNRAAADPRGAPGRAIAEEAAELKLDLLIGDLQIRRVIGHMPQPKARVPAARSERALARLQKLLG